MSRNGGLLSGLIEYARYHKRWWVLPIILALLLVGALVIIAELTPSLTPSRYMLY
jgi:hypothetical protein